MYFANIHVYDKTYNILEKKTGSNRDQIQSPIGFFFFGGGGKAEGKAKEKKTENKSLTGFLLNICLTKHIHEHGKDCLLFHTLIAVKYNNEMT